MASGAKQAQWMDFIEQVAAEQDWEVGRSKLQMRIFDGNHHATAFQVKVNRVGYLQVHAWETSHPKEDKYGRAIYSLRTESDVVMFCNILMASTAIRAKRRGDSDQGVH
jgi:hypothetical protein